MNDSKEAEEDIFDSSGNYGCGLEFWYETDCYDIKFLNRMISTNADEGKISQVQVANASIEKILKMLKLDYINSTSDMAKDILRTPGKLHIASAHNGIYVKDFHLPEIKHRAYVLERKLAESGALWTTSMQTTKMLLHLIVPSNITQFEIQYLW